MYPSITLEDARARTWDVVVAGTSFAAAFFVRALPPHLNVLLVEKGRFQDHFDQVENGFVGEEEIVQVNTAGTEKIWVAHTQYGGNSNCWTGQVPRMLPDDFRMKSTFGVAEDWLLDYDALEAAYVETEEIMGVAGGGSDHLLPRSRPFPHPPHTPSRSDVVLQAASSDWFASPSARNPDICCANGVCPICPIDAKFTVLNGHHRLAHPRARVLMQAEVRAVRIAAGTATGVVVHHGGGTHEIAADLVALGANGLFNAAILMRSGLTSPALGRYLHEQDGVTVLLDVPIRNWFGGTKITGHGYGFYAGAPRAERAAVMIENFNSPPSLRSEPGRWTERLYLKLIADDLPDANNRVVLENDEPVIHWSGHSAYARAGLDAALEGLPGALPFDVESMKIREWHQGQAHIQGTTRMGATAETGVVDATLRTHEVRNLFALGSGVFPACSPANPTLTLSALSLLAARSI